MARALWKGAISFGLVNIPVEIHPAEDRRAFQFAMLDQRDLSPVGYKRYSKKTGKEVEWDDIIKGYEYEKGRYVVLSDEDFRRANVRATQTIDIQEFIPAGEIPFEYFETPYYLVPGGRGQKVYALLRETLRATQRIALAQVVIRTTQHLAAVVVNGKALMRDTLRYHDELRDTNGLALPAEGLKAAGITAKEIELAKRLVEDMTGHWKAEEFRDTYHEDLMARIKEKVRQGQTRQITAPGKGHDETPRSAKIIDLAALLKQSLGKGTTRGKALAGNSRAAGAKPALRRMPAKMAPSRKRA